MMTPKAKDALRQRLRKALIELAAAPGASGHEAAIREELHKRWGPLTDHLEVSPLGDLAARIDGTGPSPRPALVILGHMDVIGLIVKRVNGEFVHIAGLGRPDPRVLLGQAVSVLGRQRLDGVIVRPLDSEIPNEQRDEMLRVDQLMVDLGRGAGDVLDQVKIGDLVVFEETAQALGDNLIIGPGLDNRSSLAAITEALSVLHEQRPGWDIWAVATTREELDFAGAAVSGFGLAPEMAIVVDTTFGRGPQDDAQGTFQLGEGITNGIGPLIHPIVHQLLAEAADRAGVAMADEILPDTTGTDADALQIAGVGIPTGVIGLPIRNMHTCVEMVNLDDLAGAAKVLASIGSLLGDAVLARISTAFDDA